MQASATKPFCHTLRLSLPEDETFLFRLFAESQEQLAGLRSNEALWRSLVEMQYRGRKMTYESQYPEAEELILLGDDGMPVGFLLLDRNSARWRIVDLAILASHRGGGLASSVLQEFQRQALATKVRLELQVRPGNRARRLYERLGFRTIREDSLAVEMVWATAAQ